MLGFDVVEWQNRAWPEETTTNELSIIAVAAERGNLNRDVIALCCQDAFVPAVRAAVPDNANGNFNNKNSSKHTRSSISNDVDEEKGLDSPPPRLERRQSSLRETTERLDSAMGRAMEAYQRARMEVLYGLDEHGRPLEEAAAADESGDGT